MFTTMHKFRPPNKVLTFLCPAASSALADHHRFPSWVSDNRLIQRHPRLLCLEARLSLRRLRAILAFAIVSGLFRIPFVSSRLLLHASSFDLDFAFVIFQRMRSPNRFSWNTIIRAASVCENQQTSVAFSLYAEMLLRGNLPDKYTFPFLLKACRSRSDLNYGRLLHCHALTLGLSDDIYLQTALVTMYLSCGQLDLARYVFDDIPQKDVVVWTTVISGLVENGCHEEALKVFNQMSRQIEVCENHPQGVILVKYKNQKDAEKCIELMNGRWFGGKQIHASIDNGSINHALIRDIDAEVSRLEQFGAELDAD